MRWYPERMGGGKPLEDVLASALDRALGDAYDTGEDSPAHAESLAFAGAITDVWCDNQRMANQVIPERMTTFVPRWERILGAFPRRDDFDRARRERVGFRFALLTTDVTRSFVREILEDLLGDVLVDVHHIDPADAVIWWPGGSTNPSCPWYSTVCHIPIETQKPYGYSEADFLEAVAQIFPALDDVMPAHMTWDWFRNGAGGLGFYLDQENNLDNQAFD